MMSRRRRQRAQKSTNYTFHPRAIRDAASGMPTLLSASTECAAAEKTNTAQHVTMRRSTDAA
jgi:hypothetical protein